MFYYPLPENYNPTPTKETKTAWGLLRLAWAMLSLLFFIAYQFIETPTEENFYVALTFVSWFSLIALYCGYRWINFVESEE